MKKSRKALIALLIIIILAGLLCIGFKGANYSAEESVYPLLSSCQEYSFDEIKDAYVFMPENPKAGFIFYPGALVEPDAYSPLLSELAKNNIAAIVVKMPLNFAFMNKDAADDIRDKFPQVPKWYIGGHSLGGAMAASFMEENWTGYEGLVLLASYSAGDISETNLRCLLIYGSLDSVLNSEHYEASLENLPEDSRELVIEGGNHAQFGSYGRQKKDTDASISSEEQIKETVDAIVSFIDE